MNHLPAYLDYQATTPLDPRVRDAMLPYLGARFGNPHSVDHAYGWEASQAVRTARGNVAAHLGADDDEIVFTSGATESCNLALRGVAKAANPTRRDIVTIATEHPAVLQTVRDLGASGHRVTILPVGEDGLLDLLALEQVVDNGTLVVSVMAANNEIGVLHPLPEIARICHRRGALLHTDATQAPGRIGIDVDAWCVDLLSISAHKVYGPKGVGALFARAGVPIKPIVTGGGQERGLRPGTISVPLVVGFGEACRIASSQWEEDVNRMVALTGRLRYGIEKACTSVRFFGHLGRRLPGSLCLGFPGVRADEVISVVSDRIAISTGSACSSATAEPSKVLLALGLDPDIAATAVRVSLGRFTCDGDVSSAIGALSEIGSYSWKG